MRNFFRFHNKHFESREKSIKRQGIVYPLLLFIDRCARLHYLILESMGTIREITKRDGSKSFHAEIRLRGYPPQRDSFRTKGLAKEWIQDTESALRDGRHIKNNESKKHTLGDVIDRFIMQFQRN